MALGISKLLNIGTSVKAVLTLSLVTALAIVIATAALILDLRQRRLEHAKQTVAGLSRVLSDQTTRTFDSVILAMRIINERLSDDIGSRLELDNPLAHYLLLARAQGLPQIKSIFLVNRDGFGVNSSRSDFIRNLPLQNQSFFRYHADGGISEVFISAPRQAKVDGEWTYYVSIPLRDNLGEFRGILCAAIKIEHFESLYDSIALNSVSQILLLNQSGVRLAGAPRDSGSYGQVEGNQAALSRLNRRPMDSFEETLEGPSNQRRLVVYRSIADYPLVLSIAITEEDALASWRYTAKAIISGMTLILMLIAVVTLRMLRNVRHEETLKTRLRELSASLQKIREEEGTRIARELHDELGQLLTGIRMEVSWLGTACLPPPALADKVRAIKGSIDQAIASVRRISSELHPLVLEDLGLSAAAAWYANRFSERTGLTVHLDLPQENPRKGSPVATALFRVMQEALTNVARHAKASRIDIVLERDEVEWTLGVTDDGVGFVYDPNQRGSLGLISMRERVQILGGIFAVVTTPGAGTRIQATIPLEQANGMQAEVE